MSSTESERYIEALTDDSEQAYEDFLRDFPDGKHAIDAQQRLMSLQRSSAEAEEVDAERYIEALSSGADALREFLAAYPNSKYSEAAKAKLSTLGHASPALIPEPQSPKDQKENKAPPPPSEVSRDWFYMWNGERRGPIKVERLQELVESGDLNGNTKVWTKTYGDEWKHISQVPELTAATVNWFSSAAKSAVLNGLWLGPVNIFVWFRTGRFDDPFYAQKALLSNTDLDSLVAAILVIEMLLMMVSLFVVHAIFKLAKARDGFFTWVIFLILATTLWLGLSILFGITESF